MRIIDKKNKWTKEKCIEIINKCVTKSEFRLKYPIVYKVCVYKKWLQELCENLESGKKMNNYWGKENSKIEALKYNNRSDFSKNSRGAYKASLKNGWLDEICKHMEEKGSIYKRYNYVYEFSDNHVYIGLTFNVVNRNNQHLTSEDSPVFKHIQKTGLSPILIYDSLKNSTDAQKKEIDTILEYKKNNWILLNKSRGGNLGSFNTKWDFDKCKIEALKYKTRTEFQKKSHTAYKFCLHNKILDKICSHMIDGRKRPNTKLRNENFKLNKEICLKTALLYETKKEFYTNARKEYQYCVRYKLIKEACSHMVKKYIKKNH